MTPIKLLNRQSPMLVPPTKESLIETINEELSKHQTSLLTEVTWQELKGLRDNSQLSPGSLYRITDYQCTTTQENTKSAGHQFDIVLLALSNNKLAEEGWAMMHDNIYDVTFSDGVTKKCYLYGPYDIDSEENYNLVDVSTLLGYSCLLNGEFTIEGNTITFVVISSNDLIEENLTYNYFQNSKLEAWKVWYCLDNDTTRFAWADDSLDEDSPASYNDGSFDYVRASDEDINIDGVDYYGWINEDEQVHYTTSQEPSVGDTTYSYKGEMLEAVSIISFTPAHEGTGLPNGRGVIYRLIDEWNNDVPYDFKNIQFIRKINSGTINPSTGTDTNVYTFSVCNDDTKELSDYSVTCKTFLDDVGEPGLCYENKIKKIMDGESGLHILNNVVFHVINIPNDTIIPIRHNTCESTINVTMGYGSHAFTYNIFIYASNRDYNRSLHNNIIAQSNWATFENIT